MTTKLAIALVVLASCSKPALSTDGGTDAEVEASVTPSASASAEAPPKPREQSHVTFPAVEARRTRVTKLDDDRALRANADAITKHFGGKLPSRLAVQTAELAAWHGRAILVTDDTKSSAEAAPFAFVVGVEDKAVWSKERPAAGIMAPIGPIAIAPGPSKRIALAVCDPPTASVALRLWDEDGSPFADFSIMDTEGCDGLSLLYWPKHGWLAVVVRPGITRAQLVSESGAPKWQRGVDLAARPRVATGVSLAEDSESSFVIVQRTAAEKAGASDHVLAFRYDDRAVALWTAPVDLGETSLPPGERVPLTCPRPGVVRAALGKTDVQIASSGETVK